jgi:hypothetical protein
MNLGWLGRFLVSPGASCTPECGEETKRKEHAIIDLTGRTVEQNADTPEKTKTHPNADDDDV